MIATHPDPRTILRALDVVLRLPAEAIADLAERLIDQLDATAPDPDLEPEDDACEAGECGGLHLRGDGHLGDPADAEPDDDRGGDEDEPRFPESLRSARDGLAKVRRQIVEVRLLRGGQPSPTRRMRCIPWEVAR